MMYKRETYLNMVKAFGQEIIDRAEDIVDKNFDKDSESNTTEVTVSFTIPIQMDEVPELCIDKTAYSRKVINALMEADKNL